MVLHLAVEKLESLVVKSTGVPRVAKVGGRTACSIPSQCFTQHRSGQQSVVLVVLYFAFHCIRTERNRREKKKRKKKVPQKQNSFCIQLFPRSTERCPALLLAQLSHPRRSHLRTPSTVAPLENRHRAQGRRRDHRPVRKLRVRVQLSAAKPENAGTALGTSLTNWRSR